MVALFLNGIDLAKTIEILGEYIRKYSYISLYTAPFDSRLEYYKQGKPWIFIK